MTCGVLQAAALAGVVAFAVPALAPSQACAKAVADSTLEGRSIRDVRIVAKDIYDPIPSGRSHALYGLANRLHVRSRRSTVRAALVFREGEPWSEAARAESERRLRALAFLTPDSIVATPAGDSVDVLVVTHDNWTTSPEFSLERGGGQQYGSFAFSERNLLGLGTSIGLSRQHDPVGVSTFASVEDRGTFGSRWRTKFETGTGALGRSHVAIIELPFWADAAPFTVGAQWSRDVSVTRLFSNLQGAASVPRREEALYLYMGTGRRTPDGTIHRLTMSFQAMDREVGASVLEPGASAEFAGLPEQTRLRRLGAEARLWRPRFIERQGVEQIDRIEDIDVGRSLSVMLGISPHAFGGSVDEGFARTRLRLGIDTGAPGFGLLDVDASTRLHDGPFGSYGQLDARWVHTSGTRLTAVAAVRGVAGSRMPLDFQVTVGGLNGLRAFPVRELSGTQYWRGNAEWRGVAWRNLLNVVSVGGAVFWDTARAWGRGSGTEGWHHDAGFGLRLSLPHSSLNAVARFDVAWPISPAVDGRHGGAYSFGSGQAF